MKPPKMPSRTFRYYLAVRKFALFQGVNDLPESSAFKVHRNVRVFAKEKESTLPAILGENKCAYVPMACLETGVQ